MKRKMIAVMVGAVFVAPNTWALTETTCKETTGCYYWNLEGKKWRVDGKEDSHIKINLLPETYQNAPATQTGLTESINPDGSKQYQTNSKSLISIINDGKNDISATLNVPEKTTLILDNEQDSSTIIHLIGDIHAELAKNATLIVKPNYAQQHSIVNPKGNEWDAGTALEIDNGATAKTSADIVLNGHGASAFEVNGLAKLDASNHKITMSHDFNTAVTAFDYAKVNLDNVEITGAGKFNLGVDVTYDGDHTSTDTDKTIAKLNHSTISLSNDEFTVGAAVSNGIFEANNGSKINAQYGLSTINDDIPGTSIFNINDSQVIGRKALYVSTPEEYRKYFAQHTAQKQIDALQYDATINANNSTLIGRSILDTDLHKAGQTYGKVSMNLSNNSQWNIKQNSELDNLNLDNTSTVDIRNEQSGQFNTLTINGDLTGAGTFRLNTDIANMHGDQLIIKGKASGSHVLDIANTTAEPKTTDGKLTVVQTGSSDADTFKLANGRAGVSAGKYLYALKKDGENWQLSYDTTTQPEQPVNPVTPTNPTTPESPKEPSTPTQPIVPIAPIVPPTSPTQPSQPNPQRHFSYPVMNGLAALNVAEVNLQKQNQALSTRQADLHQQQRTQGLWSQAEGGLTKRAAETLVSGSNHETANAVGFKQKDSGFTIGYDYKFGNGYIGALAGQGRHHIDFNSDLYNNLTLRSTTAALYGGVMWQQGWFVDGTLRHSHYRYDASNSPIAHDSFNVNSLNAQIGKEIALNQTWSVVPQTAITLGRVSGSKVLENSTLWQTRTGADVQGSFTLANGVWLQPKAGLYYVGDHHYARLKLNADGEQLRANTSGSRVAAKVGMDVAFGKDNQLGVNLYSEHGQRVKRPFWLDIGFRHTW